MFKEIATVAFKNVFKRMVDKGEKMIVKNGKLEERVAERLDINGDGVLNKDDIIGLIVEFVDADGDGKVSIWEYLMVILEVRKTLRERK